MKKEWKSNNYNNVRQIVEAHTHMSAEQFTGICKYCDSNRYGSTDW